MEVSNKLSHQEINDQVVNYLKSHRLLNRVITGAGLTPSQFRKACQQIRVRAPKNVGVSLALQAGQAVDKKLLSEIRALENNQPAQRVLSARHIGSLSHQVAGTIIAREQASWRGDLLELPITCTDGRLDPRHTANLCESLAQLAEEDSCRMLLQASLVRALEPLVSSQHLWRLQKSELEQESYRETTLASWAQLALFVANRPTPTCATDLLILSDYWLNGGKLDLLLLVDQHGEPIKGRLAQKAREALSPKPRSLGDLIRRIPEVGESIFFELIDFKFQIGDALTSHSTIKLAAVTQAPLVAHREQVERYLAKSNIAYRQARGLTRTPWELPVISGGQIWYVFARTPPITHRVEFTGEQRQELVEDLRSRRPQLEQSEQLYAASRSFVRQLRRHKINPQSKFDC